MLTLITLLVFIVLICWGGKFLCKNEDGKRQLHQDSMSLEVTKGLRGIAAVGVILHHISQQNAFQQANGYGKPGELFMFVNAGYLFVAIFFFCSGFGLIKSLYAKPDYLKGFLKKRVVKTLVIPFYVNVILYAIFHLIIKTDFAPQRWICNFLGLTLMNEYAWFPIVLTLLYVAFYFIFRFVKNQKLAFTLMFFVIIFQGIFFCFNGHFAWWAGEPNWWLTPAAENAAWWMEDKVIWFFGEWWVNSSIAFFVGMIFAKYEQQIYNWFKKLYALKLFLLFILYNVFHMLSGFCQMKFGYWSEWAGNGPGILDKFICYCSQLPEVIFFVILIFAVLMCFHSVNPVTNFFGNMSLETYMMNLIAITAFEFLLYKNPQHYKLTVYEVAVIGSTVLLALAYKFLCKQVNRLVK